MAHQPKRYTVGAKIFLVMLFSAFLITTSALWNVVSAASKPPATSSTTYSDLKTYHFDCDGISLDVSRDGNAPLTATIYTERGLWVEVPADKPGDTVFFYNIATSKVAKFSVTLIGGVRVLVLQTYRDMDFYNANKSQMNLRCKKRAT